MAGRPDHAAPGNGLSTGSGAAGWWSHIGGCQVDRGGLVVAEPVVGVGGPAVCLGAVVEGGDGQGGEEEQGDGYGKGDHGDRVAGGGGDRGEDDGLPPAA